MEPSTLDDLPTWAIAMLETAPVAHLGLLDEHDHPRVLPVTFALHGGALWSAIDDKPKRVAPGEIARLGYLRRRPRAVLTVDRYDDDWAQLAWVQALGEVEITDVGAALAALAALAAKYEPYRIEPPPGPLLCLTPRRAICWRAADEPG